ncbi:hypothetical protein ISF_00650 [Cordyceps fumosorosea ARSEF 2679]|uniref:SprT-like domain-containing protein n=1 Tax=Cordyceps fumosorosea (strain ARSEF 2679) TaxID=1081104 RepID=A0A162N0X0_CORFA|nr:hypothetical protein ISF_00650 [Cordyceps fumosorosea ARSEF 2679]OAA73749.1 hypothetical protein ISF_00650 [Cordyceps fumosorosea ARSEF 2679]
MSRLIDQLAHHDEPEDEPTTQELPKIRLEPKTPMRRRELVPRSTVQTSTRRVRRLDGEKLAAANPLFQPWTTESSKKVLDFSRNLSPRKAELKMRNPLMGDAVLANRRQTRQAANTTLLGSTMLHSTVSDHDSASTSFSEVDMGDVTLPASLQLASHPTELSQRMARLNKDNCVTILEDSISLDSAGLEDDGQTIKAGLSRSSETIITESISLPLSPQDANVQHHVDILRPQFSQMSVPAMDSAEKENTDVIDIPVVNEDRLVEQLADEQLWGNESSNDSETPGFGITLSRQPLTSPRKARGVPQPPHTPTRDEFWRQSLVDCWNDEHSPRKALKAAIRSPFKQAGPTKANKMSFEAAKSTLAVQFLKELDHQVTDGKITQLSESTGGVKIEWSKTLNTTAGRANWKKETVRTAPSDGTDAIVTYNHYASIELAEKVIDDESRLLNVLAHEFCHLANFMISGITNNPHGKGFKHWAAKCSRAFSSRGIKVTTKHSYEIDFKYVWQCGGCSCNYKRHSKSINPEKHRCSGCHGKLVQIKPVPRNGGNPNEYQLFIKNEMKTLRQENPGSPQKVILQKAAEKWVKRSKLSGSQPAQEVGDIVAQLHGLSLRE